MKRVGQSFAAAFAVAVFGCNASQELGLSYIPPVLSSDFDLESTRPQVREFEFGASGHYALEYRLALRHGPGSSPAPHELAGLVAIYDANRSRRLETSFRAHLESNEVGGTLLTFDSDSVIGTNPHTLAIQLELSPALIEHYMDLHIFLKRQPAFPVLD